MRATRIVGGGRNMQKRATTIRAARSLARLENPIPSRWISSEEEEMEVLEKSTAAVNAVCHESSFIS